MKKSYIKEWLLHSNYIFAVIALLVVGIGSSLISPSFLKADNLMTIVRQSSVLLILCSGLTAVVLTGGIDLSVNSTAALVGCVVAQMMVAGIPIQAAMIAGIIIGIIIGAMNGFLVGILKLPAFVATYGSNMVVSGIAIMVMKGQVVYGLPEKFNLIGVGYAGMVPIPVIIALVLTVLFYILLQKTVTGRNIYMLGSNLYAAKYSAMHINKTLISAYCLCGFTAAIGGIVMTARLNAADAAMGNTYGLQIVAAVVMGGTSLLGGEGGIVGTVVGALVLTIIANIMNLLGVSSFLQPLAVGVVIILMVWLDVFVRDRRKKIVMSLSK